uniref:Uncharacterized protein n=1 Tax=Rhizophora mucronata TaxID=61149 RepID=A0A2P2LQF5_RHIMU
MRFLFAPVTMPRLYTLQPASFDRLLFFLHFTFFQSAPTRQEDNELDNIPVLWLDMGINSKEQ